MLVEYYMAKARKAHAEFLDRLVLGDNPELLSVVNYPKEIQPKLDKPLRGKSSLIHFVEDDLCT